ncbi:MAG: DsbA family oxidoreductase [Pseudomonadota bacterium]
MNAAEKSVRVNIVSDVVCPWCVIGYRQLDRAAKDLGLELEIHWAPFELNPQMAAEGENLRAHLAAKYGTTPEGSRKARARLTQVGAELGFEFNYADDMRMVNTFRAHQLLHWAREQGLSVEHDLKQALFGAFFTHRRDLNDVDVLADVAASLDLDRAGALEALATETFADAVRREQRFWLQQGVQGVPAMVFDRRYLVTGAQGVENYTQLLRRLMEEAAA